MGRRIWLIRERSSFSMNSSARDALYKQSAFNDAEGSVLGQREFEDREENRNWKSRLLLKSSRLPHGLHRVRKRVMVGFKMTKNVSQGMKIRQTIWTAFSKLAPALRA